MINFTKSALLFSVMFLFFACSTSNPPAIGDASSPAYKHNQVVWYDLVTPNMDGAKEFYGSILGWTFSDYRVGGRKYVIAYNNSKPVAGMIEVKEANKSVWIPAVSVKDIVATSTMAKKFFFYSAHACNGYSWKGKTNLFSRASRGGFLPSTKCERRS